MQTLEQHWELAVHAVLAAPHAHEFEQQFVAVAQAVPAPLHAAQVSEQQSVFRAQEDAAPLQVAQSSEQQSVFCEQDELAALQLPP